jgi:hypothetical protein
MHLSSNLIDAPIIGCYRLKMHQVSRAQIDDLRGNRGLGQQFRNPIRLLRPSSSSSPTRSGSSHGLVDRRTLDARQFSLCDSEAASSQGHRTHWRGTLGAKTDILLSPHRTRTGSGALFFASLRKQSPFWNPKLQRLNGPGLKSTYSARTCYFQWRAK